MIQTPAVPSEILRSASMRSTRQRLLLTSLLFGQGDRHVSAEQLFEEAGEFDVPMSLATVYNTLNGLTEAGVLREVAIDGTTTLYDTKTSDHWHFYNEQDGTLTDINSPDAEVQNLPDLPAGKKVAGIDVLVRLSKCPDKHEGSSNC